MKIETNYYENKRIIVTGGAGSIGSELVRTLLKFNPKVIRVFDNNETGLFYLEQELQSEKIRAFVGDVRDKERVNRAFEDVDLVFHAAALKHVPLCEYNPFDAIKTNILGTQNVMDVALDREVEKVILISTDKAVNPTNVMGATKLLAERLTISANRYKGSRSTALSCVRFGNVLDTRGSVIPLFKKQIKKGKCITITDPNMTRFMMSISKAIGLVLKAAEMAKGGEIFIFKMPVLRIGDLAEVMLEEWAPKYGRNPSQIEIQVIGRRAGEKIYEELMIDGSEDIYENDEIFIVLPLSSNSYDLPDNFAKAEKSRYTSKDTKILTKDEIKALIDELHS